MVLKWAKKIIENPARLLLSKGAGAAEALVMKASKQGWDPFDPKRAFLFCFPSLGTLPWTRAVESAVAR